ncbi:FMN-binding negative transcriptional regulator [Taibaiella chishuiensis]|uniref:PaiB family negative transcriptional regulator n=1 Tax=Taibaiella chishuiensis TaxID=1434707 RepID=A0A2P8CVV5_9BACT|nr:FMN-binding negative transcriptional regulator [Taibaiella chishuiensis]PSK89108.1 PaiB family negative transcriptional regulator [Taibaiella chishuiensis]
MFVPHAFRFENRAEQIAFMKRYSFATLVTAVDGLPLATQLPFAIAEREGVLVLSAHFAAGNEHAAHIAAHTSLVMFTEPHAYISPTHYDKRESVPTWDYIAVHAYGKAKILDGPEAKMQAMEQLILCYEPAYLATWQTLPDRYKQGMLQGIVAFELEVTELQAKQKLSQNKSITERERIAAQLEKGNAPEAGLAPYIRATIRTT